MKTWCFVWRRLKYFESQRALCNKIFIKVGIVLQEWDITQTAVPKKKKIVVKRNIRPIYVIEDSLAAWADR